MADDLSMLIADLKENETLAAVDRALEEGVDPLRVVEKLRAGMSVVGERFAVGEYFLSEMIMAAEIFIESIAIIGPLLEVKDMELGESIVIGTVEGDIHDIGKNIVTTLLRCEGFEVHDLGVDVPPDRFVEILEGTGSRLLALSGLLTPAFDSMKRVVEVVAGAGMRDKVKIIIGGGPINDSVVDFTGADAFGKDAAQAVKLAKRFLGE